MPASSWHFLRFFFRLNVIMTSFRSILNSFGISGIEWVTRTVRQDGWAKGAPVSTGRLSGPVKTVSVNPPLVLCGGVAHTRESVTLGLASSGLGLDLLAFLTHEQGHMCNLRHKNDNCMLLKCTTSLPSPAAGGTIRPYSAKEQ
jgi:hypothetical protein